MASTVTNNTRLRAIGKAHRRKAIQAAVHEMEFVLTDSKKRFVPIALGVLRTSGHRKRTVVKGNNIIIRIAFGGAARAYAGAVHEEPPSPHHPPSWKASATPIDFKRGGLRGHLYLRRPLMQRVKGMQRRLAAATRL